MSKKQTNIIINLINFIVNLVRWPVGLLALLTAIVSFVDGFYITGSILLLICIIWLPPTNRLLKEDLNVELKGGKLVGITVILYFLLIGVAALVKSDPNYVPIDYCPDISKLQLEDSYLGAPSLNVTAYVWNGYLMDTPDGFRIFPLTKPDFRFGKGVILCQRGQDESKNINHFYCDVEAKKTITDENGNIVKNINKLVTGEFNFTTVDILAGSGLNTTWNTTVFSFVGSTCKDV